MVKQWIAAAFAVAVMLIASAQLAKAQQAKCGPRDAATKELAKKYGEASVFRGLVAQNSVIEIWLNPETGSWTATRTLPNGVLCLLTAGQAGSLMEYIAPASGTPM